MKFKLDENLPVSAAAVLAAAGHDVDTVPGEHLAGRSDQDVGLGDIRAYPPGSHAGIVILRLADQSASSVIKTIGDLASLAEPDSLAGTVAVLQRGLLRIRHP